ncbi:MAG: DOMON-like domain-containing protein, partial [Phenylobacterium sp.]
SAAEAVSASAHRRGRRLELRYAVTGTDALVLPKPAAPARTDELWKHTCVEAFVRGDGEGYFEFNLSPSGQWAAYRFDGYRSGMTDAPLEPETEVIRTADGFELAAAIELPDDGPWRVGLTAVIEGADGVSYWSLAHPAGRPDFHHADCLAITLPATGTP